MEKLTDTQIQMMMLEMLRLERNNLKTKENSDEKMVLELFNVIKEYTRQRI